MKKLFNFINILRKPSSLCLHILDVISPLIKNDRIFIQLRWNLTMDYPLNIDNPQTFSEKLQWLKLYDRKPLYTTMVDKYEVKNYVAEIIGAKYIIPTLFVYNSINEIDFDKLPNQFVLKCTHDSGGLVICRDKSQLDKEAALKKLNHYFHRKYFWQNREWPYKNVRPRIIAEKLIETAPNATDLPDYKWYCFNGEPKYCQVIKNRSTEETIDFFDTEWTHQDFVGLNPTSGPVFKGAFPQPSMPTDLKLQVKIAKELSKDIPFSRIDLYNVGEDTYFGEITFFPFSGMGSFKPEEYNKILGKMLILPGTKRGGGNYSFK